MKKKIQKYVEDKLPDELNAVLKSKRVKEIAALDDFEKTIIYKYSDDGFEALNNELAESSGAMVSAFGEMLRHALNKLPNYSGLVFRSINLTSNQIKKYKIGQIIKEPFFISTSKSRAIAMEYNGNCFFRIFAKNGKEIEKIAKFGLFNKPNEQEILFQNGTEFEVLEVTKQGKNTLITLEEI